MINALLSYIAELTNHLGLAWWIEVKTLSPICTYFFGPFLNYQEAAAALFEYVEDLESEQAQNIVTHIHRCHPTDLTVCDEIEFSY